MKKPEKKKKPENPLADLLREKQNRDRNRQFGSSNKGGQAMKPRMWNRKNGM